MCDADRDCGCRLLVGQLDFSNAAWVHSHAVVGTHHARHDRNHGWEHDHIITPAQDKREAGRGVLDIGATNRVATLV